jgi:hypothetical protein
VLWRLELLLELTAHNPLWTFPKHAINGEARTGGDEAEHAAEEAASGCGPARRARTAKSSMASLINKAHEVKERQQLEEIARAREKFRQELLEVEKAAMPDETIYPEDLKELGISEYDVTPTKNQASLGSG